MIKHKWNAYIKIKLKWKKQHLTSIRIKYILKELYIFGK